MSTVISPAFVMPGTDAAEIASRTHAFSHQIEKIALHERNSLLAKMVCHAIDKAIASDQPWPRNAFGDALQHIDDGGREVEKTGLRNPLYDFGMTISFIPDKVTSSTYGIVHTERYAWTKLWLRGDGIKNFSWGNRSDRPSSVTAADWSWREQVWERIMPTGIPAKHGLSALISPVRLHGNARNAMRSQPSLVARKKAMAEDIVMTELMPTDALNMDNIFALLMQAKAALSSAEGVSRVAEVEKGLRLPARISFTTATAIDRPTHLEFA